ncbi:MAG: NADH:flavin oxidoreductase [Deltaproteobacteria bacterium]|nr:NADH:flavin oxidoreductase [Deltaproteobacteria bacterium]
MSILFEPVRIGNFEIKNRFIRSATYFALADENGFVGDESAALMKRLASNEVGLIITGYAFVQKNGQCFTDMNGIDTDDHIPGYEIMTRAVHDCGGKIVMQIVHGGINATATAMTGGDLIAVSVPNSPGGRGVQPRELTEADIESIIDAFGQAAGRVQAAGFDGVQLHGAHGYLVTQFLSPHSNRRTDRWGGSLENRMRFAVESIRAMRKQVDGDFPIMIKLGCRDYMDTADRLTVEEGAEVAKALENEGVCHVEISHATVDESNQKMALGINSPAKEAYMLADAQVVRNATDLSLGLVGGMRSLPVMEDIVQSAMVDTISICRPLIREPDLIKQWQSGSQKPADCISCRKCFQEKDGKMFIACGQV